MVPITSYDNGDPAATPDWSPVAKHCGQLCTTRECEVCGVTIPQNIHLSDN